MAAADDALSQLNPLALVRSFAANVPTNLSKSPILGIVGVILGAGIVTLTSRMLSLGVEDLKGHLGISYDAGAWIGTSFDMALIFIGPLTVYIGGLLGARRVLFYAAGTFAACCVVLPFIHSYSLLLAVLVVAGLTSGTFYPLTLTFALRNIAIRYLPYTIALYATCVDFSVNVAPTLYGWYRDHLSWHWMFWNSAWLTPIMMAFIYWGIPPSPPPKRTGPPPSFAGFFYFSAGLAILIGAFEQGERLDWWRSGVFIALFAGGVFFLLCGFGRRLLAPNPLVAVQFLRRRNTLLLGFGLFFFRFTLLGTILLVPQSLAIHGFEAVQIGPALIWTALPQLPVAFAIAFLLARNADPRLLLATGCMLIAFACCLNAGLTSAWSAPDYYRTELLMGMGQSFAFLGLVSAIILQGLFAGGMVKPQWILTFSAYFHVVRLFGGNLGGVFMGHFLAQREKFHSNLLGLHVQRGNWITDGNLGHMTAALFSKSPGTAAAAVRAAGLMAGRVRLQAYTLTFIDGFYLVAWMCVGLMLISALLKESPMKFGHVTALVQTPAAPEEAGT